MNLQGITENDIAEYLANTPGFFERHAELLSSVQLTSPHGQRAVSLQERQMEMLRDRIKGLEMRIVEMIRHSQENVGIAERLHRWTRALLVTADAAALPEVLVDELQHQFMIPQAALRLWNVAPAHEGQRFSAPVSDDVKSFTDSLSQPYCGVNAGFESVGWLPEPSAIASLALIPLRNAAGSFGLLILGSPDPTRYSADMGTEFLVRIGDTAGAALSRLTA
ncbi:MAG: DUF484 family protein [Rubrivivax sp.]|uniref:DUF484 family protein n=1 Tax=Rubrivivax gelatinosus (strain NBRC 100245 / IL144) TaxID=983917 RepID=I0HLH1_RUBGI|nr:DUF484 family protein [Rubrivivax gelatinosus]MBG6080474.1 uncharacterized protein YigA (DUF484 family) [Rubrivivax gelatinosus]BAL93858.1 hypothetical protein RGE_05130 [Rubrivivax gelatinosus IL144]